MPAPTSDKLTDLADLVAARKILTSGSFPVAALDSLIAITVKDVRRNLEAGTLDGDPAYIVKKLSSTRADTRIANFQVPGLDPLIQEAITVASEKNRVNDLLQLVLTSHLETLFSLYTGTANLGATNENLSFKANELTALQWSASRNMISLQFGFGHLVFLEMMNERDAGACVDKVLGVNPKGRLVQVKSLTKFVNADDELSLSQILICNSSEEMMLSYWGRPRRAPERGDFY
ncbi:MAG: hypothetical protein Q9169_008248 [Polycauliona sp. 2 TL-2023]